MLYFMQQVEAWCIDSGGQSHKASEFGVQQTGGVGMSLLQFCKTERQKAVVSRVEQGASQRDIAKELGLTRSTVVSHLANSKRLRRQAGL